MRANSGTAAFSGGGTQRTIDVVSLWSVQQTTNFNGGALGFWSDGFCLRSGTVISGVFPNGANAPTEIAAGTGRPTVYFGADGLVRDKYCNWAPAVQMLKPAVALANPFAVWEVEAHLNISKPAVNQQIVGDCGLVMHGNTGVTGWGNDFRNGGGAGDPGQLGYAIFFWQDAANAEVRLRYMSRATIAGALGDGTDLGTAGPFFSPGGGDPDISRIVRIKCRHESATLSLDAKVTIFIDDVPKLTRFMSRGALLPNPDNTLGPASLFWLGAFRPFVRNHTTALVSSKLGCTLFRVSAAPSVAALG